MIDEDRTLQLFGYTGDTLSPKSGKKLSVHHVDMNKEQGCDGHVWQLVPLCASCHSRAHNDTWWARIEYLLTVA